jgi:hypothetical protein
VDIWNASTFARALLLLVSEEFVVVLGVVDSCGVRGTSKGGIAHVGSRMCMEGIYVTLELEHMDRCMILI